MSRTPHEKITVLIIDDDQAISDLIQTALGHDDYQFVYIDNGICALEKFDAIHPDLVILDVVMPEMDGFEVCRQIRKKQSGHHIPLIMMTSLNDINSINHAYQSGASNFILKPFNHTILSYQVRSLLKTDQTATDLRNTRALLETAQHIAKSGHWEWDFKRKKIVWSRGLRKILRLREDAKPVSLAEILLHIHPQDKKRANTAIKKAIRDRSSFSLEFRLILVDGSTPTILHEGEVFLDSEGNPQKMVGTIQDISLRKDSEEKIKTLANFNNVTGLPNRSLLKRILKKRINSSRYKHPIAVLTINLDRFNLVKDSYGHAFSENLLRKVAINLIRCIKNSIYFKDKSHSYLSSKSILRKPLTVSHSDGDEFVVVLSKILNTNDAAMVARSINQAISEPYHIAGQEIRITASIGISIYPMDGQTSETILKHSSTALYHAKDEGGDGYQFYLSNMNTHAFERVTLETSLRKAIEEQQFELYYQPKMTLSGSTISGMEVLLRWRHPQLGIITPGEFIHILEETCLIVELGEWVIKTVCNQIKHWKDSGYPTLPVAINLSAVQLKQKDFHLRLCRALNEARISPAMIELEITESMLMSDMEKSISMLKKLRTLGVQIALDDFGTGYSSLTYLKHFPVNTLKIDRSFLNNVTTDPDDAAIVKGIIALAHSMQLTVVAEGIERESQLQFLKDSDCDLGQGYFFSAPIEVDALSEHYLKKTHYTGSNLAG